MSDENSDVRFDNEMGVHHAKSKIDTKESGSHYDFEVEAEAVFKRLAEDIYKSTSAGVREPVTNAVTSVIRAEENGYLDKKEDGIIVFELYEDGPSTTLIIRDNGVGMTKDEIDKVVTRIGKSTARSDTELTGRFGMGFLATWMLAGGTDGGFIMRSNPRGVDDGPFTGVWTSSGFTELDEELNNSYGGLSENQYGVELEINLDESISTQQIENWIDEYSEWTRVPVLFRHHKDGKVEDEEYPTKSVKDHMENIEEEDDPSNQLYVTSDDLRYYTVEHEAFTAVNSNLKENSRGYGGNSINNWILMDVPISSGSKHSGDYPLSSIHIRINYETPMVVDGPHKGKFVEMGSDIPERLREKEDVISKEKLVETDIVTPYPIGTRDTLKDETGFRQWLAEEFKKLYYKDMATIVCSVENLDQYTELSDEERNKFHNNLDEIADHRVTKSTLDRLQNVANTSFTDNFEKAIICLENHYVGLAPEGKGGVSRQQNRKTVDVSDIVTETHNKDKDVFMAHRISQEKAEFVWDAEKDHKVVRVDSSRQDTYEQIFGWKSLTDLDFETDLNLERDDRRKYLETSDVEDKTVTLHIGSYSNTVKYQAKQLKQAMEEDGVYLEDNDNEKYDIKKLIIFQRGGYNISGNKQLAGDYIATVSTPEDVFEYLKDTENVWTAEKAVDKYSVEVTLSDGTNKEITDDIPENFVVHVMDKDSVEHFRKQSVMKSIESYLSDNNMGPDNPRYLPLSYFEVEFADLSMSWNTYRIDTRNYNQSRYNQFTVESDVSLYVRAVLDLDEKIESALKQTKANWNEGGKELIEELTGKSL